MSKALVEKIVDNLHLFTNPIAQRHIAEAIENGKFGDPMSEELAEKIVDNLHLFTDPTAQRHIA